MKLVITLDQFNALNELGKERYRENIYGMSKQQLANAFKGTTFADLEKRGSGNVPLMDIGEMISFLVKNGSTINPRNNLHTIVWDKNEELADHLWGIVVRVLEEKK